VNDSFVGPLKKHLEPFSVNDHILLETLVNLGVITIEAMVNHDYSGFRTSILN